MIAGIFHEGSGLGNQLFRYITTRTLAEDKGYEWAMLHFGTAPNPAFKGDFFNDFDGGRKIQDDPLFTTRFWYEKKVVEGGIDIRSYDPEINFVQDETIIDGEFQDDKYWRHKLPEIDKWLSVTNLPMNHNMCVIGFRGGEYYSDSSLGLPKSYYDEAIEKMRQMNSSMVFEVHTDDTYLAHQFFPDFPVIDNNEISHSRHSNMGYNWRAMRYAKYAIIANSSFYILPRILSGGITVAPRYWARRNTNVWALPSNYYPEFTYV